MPESLRHGSTSSALLRLQVEQEALRRAELFTLSTAGFGLNAGQHPADFVGRPNSCILDAALCSLPSQPVLTGLPVLAGALARPSAVELPPPFDGRGQLLSEFDAIEADTPEAALLAVQPEATPPPLLGTNPDPIRPIDDSSGAAFFLWTLPNNSTVRIETSKVEGFWKSGDCDRAFKAKFAWYPGANCSREEYAIKSKTKNSYKYQVGVNGVFCDSFPGLTCLPAEGMQRTTLGLGQAESRAGEVYPGRTGQSSPCIPQEH